MKKWIVLTLVVLLGASYLLLSGGKNDIPRFRTAKVDTGTVIATASATGTVEPVILVQVGSQVSGTIAALHKTHNDPVTQGEIICELDPTTLRARVKQDRANLLKARAQVDRILPNLGVAERELERRKQLYADSVISEAELDQQQAVYDVFQADLKVAKAEVAQTEAALELSEANLSYATIRSPVNGVVISRDVDVGQTVAASFQAPVLFTIAQNLEEVHVLADVAQADVGRVREEQAVTFTVDAYPDTEFRGTVQQIRLAPTEEQNVVTYTVVVTAKNTKGRLFPGMKANMAFVVDQTGEEAVRVPNSALRFQPEVAWLPADYSVPAFPEGESQAWRYLWIREGRFLKAIAIKSGLTDGRFTQVLAGNLPPQTEVVIGTVSEEPSNARNPFLPRIDRSKKKKK